MHNSFDHQAVIEYGCRTGVVVHTLSSMKKHRSKYMFYRINRITLCSMHCLCNFATLKKIMQAEIMKKLTIEKALEVPVTRFKG